jgi:ribosomal-protein-serine acetyltransferase
MEMLLNARLTRETLELRPLEIADAHVLFSIIDKNREYLKTWLTWLDRTKSVDDVVHFIQTSHTNAQNGRGVDFGIFENSKLVGVIGLKDLDVHQKKVTIGYWIDKDTQGKGIMTKSVSLLIEFIFTQLSLHRIQITCSVGNAKSCAIPERLGFTKEGIARDAEWLNDHFVDWNVYSLLKHEWEIV